MTPDLLSRLHRVYEDLHQHPELSFHEVRTAGIVAAWLKDLGYDVTEGIATTGVAGVFRNGDGPTVLLRADMDALPVSEDTGLEYSSAVDGVAHVCGHDMHVTCLLGAASDLADARSDWSGTLVVVFQPAEQTLEGAAAMVADGLYDRVPVPDICLGQHVSPLPAGMLGLMTGVSYAASDALRVTLYGSGGHGSRPEATVDPVFMAAATVMRLQGIVSRKIAATDVGVVTVGAMNAGTKGNVIPDKAELLLSVRTIDPDVRKKMLEDIERVVCAEAQASGATTAPTIDYLESAPVVINEVAAGERTRAALASVVGKGFVVNPGLVTGSEDVGILGTAAGAPTVYWLLGGADPALFSEVKGPEDLARIARAQPSNHSPRYAPVEDPTIQIGVDTLVAAAQEWLDRPV